MKPQKKINSLEKHEYLITNSDEIRQSFPLETQSLHGGSKSNNGNR